MSTNVSYAAGAGGVGNIDINSTDIETALMAVQTQRSNLLETQLKDQMSVVQQRNRQIESINQMLACVRQTRPASADGSAFLHNVGNTVSVPREMIGDEADMTNKLTADVNWARGPDGASWAGSDVNRQKANQQIGDASASGLAELADPKAGSIDMQLQRALEVVGLGSYFGKDLKQGQFDQLISTLTSKIDSLNSSQQMDMLRLQSLTNKRNEAFDLMTNFMKKMQDSRSSILGNLR